MCPKEIQVLGIKLKIFKLYFHKKIFITAHFLNRIFV